jgi:hypothetical protein
LRESLHFVDVIHRTHLLDVFQIDVFKAKRIQALAEKLYENFKLMIKRSLRCPR